MLNRSRKSFVVSKTSSSCIGFAASIVVRDVDVIAGESITSFDVCRINLCDSLNATIYWSVFSFLFHLTPYHILLDKRCFDVTRFVFYRARIYHARIVNNLL